MRSFIRCISHMEKIKPSTFKTWALAGHQYFKSFTVHNSKKRCHLPANQHCSYSFLKQLCCTACLAVLHRLYMCLTEPRWLSTLRFQDEKHYTYTTSIHSFGTRKYLCFFLMLSSEIQINTYTVIWKYTHIKTCRFTPHRDKAT